MAYGWLGTYAYRRRIYVDATNIDESLSHFPIPIVLGTSVGQDNQDVSDIFDEVGSEYLKIAVTGPDKSVQLYCDVELWDSINEKAVIHVSASTLSINASSDTEIYIYFDSTQDDNTTYVGLSGSTPAQSVWDANFKAVYHMNQDPSGGAGAILDSTANENNGTSGGTMLTEDLVDADVGKAIDFDGSDDLIDCQSDASLDDLTTMSLEMMLNVGSQGGEFFNKTNWKLRRDDIEGYNTFDLSFDDTDGQWSFPIVSNGSYTHLALTFNNTENTNGISLSDPCEGYTGEQAQLCATEFAWYYAGDDPCDGVQGSDCQESYAWYYSNLPPWKYPTVLTGEELALKKEEYFWVHERVRQDPLVYLDGVAQTVTVEQNPIGDYNSDASHGLFIGNTSAQNSGLNANVAEVRISSSIRSAAWIKATHYSLTDDLLTFEDASTYDDDNDPIVPETICFEEDPTLSDPYDVDDYTANPYGVEGYTSDPYGDCDDSCATFSESDPYDNDNADPSFDLDDPYDNDDADPDFDPDNPYDIVYCGEKSVRTLVIDCADCYVPTPAWGYIGIRNIRLYHSGINGGYYLSNAYATTYYDASRHPRYAFDQNDLYLVGTDGWHTWLSGSGKTTNQRIIGVFTGVVQDPVIADSVVINNYHAYGGNTEWGAKNIKIYVTEDIYTDTTYGATVTNGTLVYDGVLDEHTAVDEADSQTINF